MDHRLGFASGILFAPLTELDALLLTLLVVQAFGAAAVGTRSTDVAERETKRLWSAA